MRRGIQDLVLGFTGTRNGMTKLQRENFIKFVRCFNPVMFHHGDCIGADEEAHEIVDSLGIPITIHPPLIDAKRAYCNRKKNKVTIEITEEFEYLKRNRHIVNSSDVVVAIPKKMKEELASGTWATVRYAKSIDKTVFIIWPQFDPSRYPWSMEE